MLEIDARTAIVNGRTPKADWAVARRRMRAGFILPVHLPTFELEANDTIFTMGSCFARNIEKHLTKLGCPVPTHHFSLPEVERTAHTPPNDAITLFTPPTFAEVIAWVEKIHLRDGKVTRADCEPWFFHFPDGSVWDLGLAAVKPIDSKRAVDRRQEIFDLYRTAFTAQCVMMTPGLVEAWYDKKFGVYTVYAPIWNGKLVDPERYCLRVLNYDDCYEALARCIEIIRKHNSATKILITVSPVPLRYTFSNTGILVANSYSKSTLRAVCERLTEQYTEVDYFPSLEAVNYSTKRVWQRDRRHVSEAMVRKIAENVVAVYFRGQTSEYYEKYRYPLWRRLLRALAGRKDSPAN